jgi:hypothetical protein
MADRASLAELAEFSGKNIAHNLDFVPEDKLMWKPAPEAKSVAEIVDHIGGNLHGFLGDGEYTPVTSVEQAKKTIVESTAALAAWLRQQSMEGLENEMPTPVGPMKGTHILPIAVFDLAYHSGQICYLQTLWADPETHMLPMEPIVS